MIGTRAEAGARNAPPTASCPPERSPVAGVDGTVRREGRLLTGCGLLAHWQGSGRRAPGAELFREPGHLGLYAALLLAGAAAFAALGRRAARPG